MLVGEDVALRVIHHAGALALLLAAGIEEAAVVSGADRDVDNAGTGLAVHLVHAEAPVRAERGRESVLANDGGGRRVAAAAAGDCQGDGATGNRSPDDRKQAAEAEAVHWWSSPGEKMRLSMYPSTAGASEKLMRNR